MTINIVGSRIAAFGIWRGHALSDILEINEDQNYIISNGKLYEIPKDSEYSHNEIIDVMLKVLKEIQL
jgi:hypothetical protein